MAGHRDLRRVPAGWIHPAGEDGEPRPLEPAGLYATHLGYALDDMDEHPGEADHDVPAPGDYMPAFDLTDGSPSRYMLYSHGVPASPAFASMEDAAAWCADNETIYGSTRWTREQWLASFRAGATSADSLITAGPRRAAPWRRLLPRLGAN